MAKNKLSKEERAQMRALKNIENEELRAIRKEEREEKRALRKASFQERRSSRKPLFSENKVRQSLKRNKDKAAAFLNDDEKMDHLLEGFEQKLKLVPRVGHRLADLPVMVSMLRSYVRREYTKVPLDTMLLVLAAVIYVVNPLDVVPDTLPGLGYLDDATAITIVLNAIHSDIQDYKKWQAARKAARQGELEEVEVIEEVLEEAPAEAPEEAPDEAPDDTPDEAPEKTGDQ